MTDPRRIDASIARTAAAERQAEETDRSHDQSGDTVITGALRASVEDIR
jgi:hypothetical protein